MEQFQQIIKSKLVNTPNTTQTPKTQTPRSLEHTNLPHKKLNMEDSAMEIENDTNQVGIPRGNTGGTNTSDVTR